MSRSSKDGKRGGAHKLGRRTHCSCGCGKQAVAITSLNRTRREQAARRQRDSDDGRQKPCG